MGKVRLLGPANRTRSVEIRERVESADDFIILGIELRQSMFSIVLLSVNGEA